ncbi:mercury(II) reductase [Acidianus sulfidivorans JP7]|uniref:Mercuric reductase n=1 Tax=Acidianus sulfidivorans JP7 TaxID=619593 RepID=A0A2U9IL39_9CREN|nr:mercury(II) reductase [Acidianus sulfidivorans]AWR96737.1 mercury(II) reductase [Acidianus sulfidivorans JP7]
MQKKLVIIGYGAAGFAALIKANELGVKPVLIGYGPIGGTCVNVGCVPSKKVLNIGENYFKSKKYCNNCNVDFSRAFEEEKELVSKLRKTKYEDVLSSYDVELIEGKAHFISPHEIKVNNNIIEAEKFIIATGSSPYIPEINGINETGFWTNVEALNPDRKIESLVIIGGRAQALEFAQMYKRLGVDVAVLERGKRLIRDWEPEVSLEAKKILEEEGIIIATNLQIKEVKKEGNAKRVITTSGDVEADEILLATGRKPNVDLGLEKAMVSLNQKGGILVDEELRTTNPDIFAAGDVIGDKMLEALAGREGSVAVENAILNSHKKIDRLSIPQVIFIEPNLAYVGLKESEVESPDVRTVYMEDIAKANIINETRGFVKMITKNRKILGVHLVMENGAEVINEAALAIKMRATVDDLIDTIHVFPTMAEALRIAALAFNTDVKKMSCCV